MDPRLALAVAYLAGCVSFATLVARAHGVDIRAHGSGNPGATNVGRVLGRRWGTLVLLLDVAKGLLPVLLLRGPEWGDPSGRTSIATAAVLGHMLPVTSAFRGGKGVATLLGAHLGLDPLLGSLSVAVHLAIKKGTGFVALASVALAWSFPLAQTVLRAGGWGEGRHLAGTPLLAALAALVTLRHVGNFRRMIAGTEDRYDAGSPHPAPGAGPDPTTRRNA